MKVAVIGSRNITKVDSKDFLPSDTTEFVSEGAKAIDSIIPRRTAKNEIKYTKFYVATN